mgnify:CR=1 FL=1
MKAEQLDKFLISSESAVVEAMQKIDSNARGILFVTDNKQKLTGVLTDGDIRRWLIRTGDLQAAIEKFMNTAPKKNCKKRNKTGQKMLMQQYSITALPVVTAKGIVSDIIFRDEKAAVHKDIKGTLKDVPVIIMAGGKGTRLYPYTKIFTKAVDPHWRYSDYGKNYYKIL